MFLKFVFTRKAVDNSQFGAAKSEVSSWECAYTMLQGAV